MLLNLGRCVEMQRLSWPGHAASSGGGEKTSNKIYIFIPKPKRVDCAEHNHLHFIWLNLIPKTAIRLLIATALGPPRSCALQIRPLPPPVETMIAGVT